MKTVMGRRTGLIAQLGLICWLPSRIMIAGATHAADAVTTLTRLRPRDFERQITDADLV
jgi:hypothetical protein